MIIVSDLDDTLEDLVPVWVDWLNRKYGLNKQYEDITEWDMCKNFSTLTYEEICWPLDQEEFWAEIKPKEGAAYFFKKLLDDGHQVYICTASHHNNINYKYKKVIKRYFPFIDWHNVIVTSHKELIKADVFIDDNPLNLQQDDCCKKFLFDAPHNRSSRNTDLTRVYHWAELYDKINLIK